MLKEKKKSGLERQGEDRRRCRRGREPPLGDGTQLDTLVLLEMERRSHGRPWAKASRHIEKGKAGGDGDAPSRQAEADQQLEHRQTDRPTGLPKEGMGQEPGRMVVLPDRVAKEGWSRNQAGW